MHHLLAALLIAISPAATLAAQTYELMPGHTYPSFEADHQGGLSVWRGKFTKTTGRVILDRQARTGALDVVIETASIDVGHAAMNAVLKSAKALDAEKFPSTYYRGTAIRFDGDQPAEVTGELTLHGVTRPVKLRIVSFKCMHSHLYKREICGVDAIATFDRSDFGIDINLDIGFKPEIRLAIQAEALLKAD